MPLDRVICLDNKMNVATKICDPDLEQPLLSEGVNNNLHLPGRLLIINTGIDRPQLHTIVVDNRPPVHTDQYKVVDHGGPTPRLFNTSYEKHVFYERVISQPNPVAQVEDESLPDSDTSSESSFMRRSQGAQADAEDIHQNGDDDQTQENQLVPDSGVDLTTLQGTSTLLQ